LAEKKFGELNLAQNLEINFFGECLCHAAFAILSQLKFEQEYFGESILICQICQKFSHQNFALCGSRH